MATLQEQLDNTATSAWNAAVTEDEVAVDCKVKKGESLLDRIMKCESRLQEWDLWLKSLEKDLPALEKLIDPAKENMANDPAHTARIIADLLKRDLETMRKTYKRVRREFDGHKATLRKVKAK